MTIEDIYRNEDLSIRSFNVCINNGLQDLRSILDYYSENSTFINLRNCGQYSNKELVDICRKYNDDQRPLKQNDRLLQTEIEKLDRNQRAVINSFVKQNINELSVRSQNALNFILDHNINIRNIGEKVFCNNSFRAKDLKNIGEASVKEIERFRNNTISFIKKISSIQSANQLNIMQTKLLLQYKYPEAEIPNEILEGQSIFSLVEFLFRENILFKKKYNDIFKLSFGVFQNQKILTIDEIAREVDLSKERVRQIRIQLPKELFSKLRFIQNINDDLHQKYNIDLDGNQIEINEEDELAINKLSNTSFRSSFILLIVSTYVSDQFSLIGNINDVWLTASNNSNNRHNWKTNYLLKKELTDKFDFEEFTSDINRRISERIKESYSFNFKSYLSQFLTNNNIDILDSIFPIAEKIANDEFQIYLDLEESIIFQRKTLKKVHEYAFEALEHLGAPSKVKDISKKISELYPNYDTKEDKIGRSMKREYGFIPIGRKSVFGLKKWENEIENFKGGTIKDVIIEFLNEKKEPKHILEILNYLNKFREDKNAKSVITNLKVDPNKRFLIYNQSFIGLKSNSGRYSSKYEKIPQQLGKTIISLHKNGYTIEDIKGYLNKTWHLTNKESQLIIKNLDYFSSDSFIGNTSTGQDKNSPFSLEECDKAITIPTYDIDALINFISANQRMPSSRDRNERKLYQFYYRKIKNRANNETITNQEAVLFALLEKHGNSKRRARYSINDLLSFIRKNNRMPDSKDSSEKKLYQFFYRQKKLFDTNKLEAKEEIQFIEIVRILQNI